MQMQNKWFHSSREWIFGSLCIRCLLDQSTESSHLLHCQKLPLAIVLVPWTLPMFKCLHFLNPDTLNWSMFKWLHFLNPDTLNWSMFKWLHFLNPPTLNLSMFKWLHFLNPDILNWSIFIITIIWVNNIRLPKNKKMKNKEHPY